jgi:hypothetical protein
LGKLLSVLSSFRIDVVIRNKKSTLVIRQGEYAPLETPHAAFMVHSVMNFRLSVPAVRQEAPTQRQVGELNRSSAFPAGVPIDILGHGTGKGWDVFDIRVGDSQSDYIKSFIRKLFSRE